MQDVKHKLIVNRLIEKKLLKTHFPIAHSLLLPYPHCRASIRTVINLQEPGEHKFCGPALLPSGFTYDPEEALMKHDSELWTPPTRRSCPL